MLLAGDHLVKAQLVAPELLATEALVAEDIAPSFEHLLRAVVDGLLIALFGGLLDCDVLRRFRGSGAFASEEEDGCGDERRFHGGLSQFCAVRTLEVRSAGDRRPSQ